MSGPSELHGLSADRVHSGARTPVVVIGCLGGGPEDVQCQASASSTLGVRVGSGYGDTSRRRVPGVTVPAVLPARPTCAASPAVAARRACGLLSRPLRIAVAAASVELASAVLPGPAFGPFVLTLCLAAFGGLTTVLTGPLVGHDGGLPAEPRDQGHCPLYRLFGRAPRAHSDWQSDWRTGTSWGLADISPLLTELYEPSGVRLAG